jgi:hypothetical protein
VDLLSTAFVDRFARFCGAVARFMSERTDEVPFYAPINEISFLSWAIGHGIISPFADNGGREVKRQLVRAAIAGMDAVWSVDKRARFVHEDPVIHVVPPRELPELALVTEQQYLSQYEAWDMIAGRLCPELGGALRYLDIVGISYYHANQWEYPQSRLRWEDIPRDERWRPFHQIIAEVYECYRRPLLVGETSDFGTGRAPWIREIAAVVYAARTRGIPVEAICIYPILDRYDWEDATHWHNSGLWDLHRDSQGHLRRALNREYADELRRAQLLPGMGGCHGQPEQHAPWFYGPEQTGTTELS